MYTNKFPDWSEAWECVLNSVRTGKATDEEAQEFLRLVNAGATSKDGTTDFDRLRELCTLFGITAKQVLDLSPGAIAKALAESRYEAEEVRRSVKDGVLEVEWKFHEKPRHPKLRSTGRGHAGSSAKVRRSKIRSEKHDTEVGET